MISTFWLFVFSPNQFTHVLIESINFLCVQLILHKHYNKFATYTRLDVQYNQTIAQSINEMTYNSIPNNSCRFYFSWSFLVIIFHVVIRQSITNCANNSDSWRFYLFLSDEFVLRTSKFRWINRFPSNGFNFYELFTINRPWCANYCNNFSNSHVVLQWTFCVAFIVKCGLWIDAPFIKWCVVYKKMRRL